MKKLYVLIGVDCDHDRKPFNKSIKENGISWIGFKYFYNYFNKIRKKISNEYGLTPILTLNIRADEQVKKTNGRYDYCFNLFKNNLANNFNSKDELAWHNHQWRLKNNKWVQEMKDKIWLENNIRESFESIKQYQINTLHTGWCFQNNFTMNLYSDLGIKEDYSALPGMRKTTGSCNKYDYSSVKSNEIYIPSRNNYQKKDLSGENQILEMPTTTIKSSFLNFLRLIENFQKTKQVKDFGFQNSYLNISINPFLYNIFLKKALAQDNLKYFITFFHSDELLPDNLKSRQIKWLYRQDNIYHNLKRLIIFM